MNSAESAHENAQLIANKEAAVATSTQRIETNSEAQSQQGCSSSKVKTRKTETNIPNRYPGYSFLFLAIGIPQG